MTFHGPRERPTAAFVVRDVSASPSRASAPPEARGISVERREAALGMELREGARRKQGPIREECVCGGPELVAVTFLPHDIVEAVQRHQVEPVHIAYDVANGIPLSFAQGLAYSVDRGH